MLEWIFLGPARWVALAPASLVLFAIALIVVTLALRVSVAATQSAPPFFREPAVFAALLWAIYLPYELQMGAAYFHRYGANGGTALRWDLLILTPILVAMSAFAIGTLLVRIARWWKTYRGR